MTATLMPALTIERAVFEREHDDLFRSHPNEFVLIKGQQIVGTFATRNDGEQAGYRKFGFDEAFLVRQILESPDQEEVFQLLNLDAYISDS
jgi:hypothetical protein